MSREEIEIHVMQSFGSTLDKTSIKNTMSLRFKFLEFVNLSDTLRDTIISLIWKDKEKRKCDGRSKMYCLWS